MIALTCFPIFVPMWNWRHLPGLVWCGGLPSLIGGIDREFTHLVVEQDNPYQPGPSCHTCKPRTLLAKAGDGLNRCVTDTGKKCSDTNSFELIQRSYVIDRARSVMFSPSQLARLGHNKSSVLSRPVFNERPICWTPRIGPPIKASLGNGQHNCSKVHSFDS